MQATLGGEAPLSGSNLFVLGCARSGTTILQNALNDSDQVFLFGEPDFHTDPGTPDFARRYNAMHRSWGNQATKSTFCPPFFAEDATWFDHLQGLAEHYKLVGAKIVLNADVSDEEIRSLFDFQCRHFYDAHYLFIFRDPLAMAQSVQEFRVFTGGVFMPFEALMANYVAALNLFILMLRNLPNVHIVFHDDMARRTFTRLGRRLGVRLDGAHRYYDRGKVKTYDPTALLELHGERARVMMELYAHCRRAAAGGFGLAQIEQNSANLSPTHLTALGHLAVRSELIAAGLRLGTIPGGTDGR